MSLRVEGQSKNPNHGFRGEIEVQAEGQTTVLDSSDPREMLLVLNKLLLQYDPDLLVSEYGDSFILPQLLQLSQRYGVPLRLNRDSKQAPLFKRAYSYTSYGRVVHRSASQTLFGGFDKSGLVTQ
jgi:DNA polymerase-2